MRGPTDNGSAGAAPVNPIGAISAGLAAGLLVHFVMNPMAVSSTGATFAAASIYAFMLKAATGFEIGSTVGAAIHWTLFVFVVPLVWIALARRASQTSRVALALVISLGAWVLLMAVLMPASGLPFFYNFSLTTIWSGVAFAILGAALASIPNLTLKGAK